MDSLIEDLDEAIDIIGYLRRLRELNALGLTLLHDNLDKLSALAVNALNEAHHYAFILATEGKDDSE